MATKQREILYTLPVERIEPGMCTDDEQTVLALTPIDDGILYTVTSETRIRTVGQRVGLLWRRGVTVDGSGHPDAVISPTGK